MSLFQDQQWVGNNRFSSLFNLGGAMGVWSGGKEDLMEEASVCEEQGCAQEVDLVSPILTGCSSEILLPWDYSGFEKNGCLGGEKDQCLLGCPPLSQWDPIETREVMLDQEFAAGIL